MQNIKKFSKYSVITFPARMSFGGFKTIIPNHYIKRISDRTYRINLPDEQKLKIRKGEVTKEVTILQIKSIKQD